jgi:hypothetical protein
MSNSTGGKDSSWKNRSSSRERDLAGGLSLTNTGPRHTKKINEQLEMGTGDGEKMRSLLDQGLRTENRQWPDQRSWWAGNENQEPKIRLGGCEDRARDEGSSGKTTTCSRMKKRGRAHNMRQRKPNPWREWCNPRWEKASRRKTDALGEAWPREQEKTRPTPTPRKTRSGWHPFAASRKD